MVKKITLSVPDEYAEYMKLNNLSPSEELQKAIYTQVVDTATTITCKNPHCKAIIVNVVGDTGTWACSYCDTLHSQCNDCAKVFASGKYIHQKDGSLYPKYDVNVCPHCHSKNVTQLK